jgi:hypothetical protein
MIKHYLPLCPLHYHQGVSGKTPSIQLKGGLGSATYDAASHVMVYPPSVPKERLPIPKGELKSIKRKGLVAGIRFSESLGSSSNPIGQLDSKNELAGQSVGPFGFGTSRADQSVANLEIENAYEDTSVSGPLVEPRVVGPHLLVCTSATTKNVFYVDSGAGQCLSSCSTAFMTLEPCNLEVVGVAGRLSIFGRGTAVFALSFHDTEILIRVHNCLYSFGEFNLLSVSQMQTIKGNTLNLSLESPSVRLRAGSHPSNVPSWERQPYVDVPLGLDDGLYCLMLEPISSDDPRFRTLQMFDLTPPGHYEPCSHRGDRFVGVSKGIPWTTTVVGIPKPLGRIFSLNGSIDFHSGLTTFSDKFLAPAGLPPARKQYDTSNSQDMSDLSIRFLGGGTDRILHTVNISNGLKDPPSKKHARVPPLNFPQGNMKKFKTPRVDKGNVGHNKQASIAEVVYTDTFETGDIKFPYAQVFVDRISRYGDVVPMRSRTEVGQSFVTFVCRHFVPLILISDNIAENHGGNLRDQCRARDVKQLFTCPNHPEQNFAENYIGRITTTASFGMVYAGAPLFMWIWAVKTAVFVDHIMASYYSQQQVWATSYELIHGELYPDASIVVPFGCGVLVLLTEKERSKFKSRCALMVFVHYADQHPLYTYAVYSPRTRKVLMRQDCIFLTKLFPMRIARVNSGMEPDGEELKPIRSPAGVQCTDPDLSFEDWTVEDPLPSYEDHVKGWKLTRPKETEMMGSSGHHESSDSSAAQGEPHFPSNPSFGAPSIVPVNPVPRSSGLTSSGSSSVDDSSARQGSITMGFHGAGFSIWLEYPGTNREAHLHRVYASMLVTDLYNRIAERVLLCDATKINLLVQQDHLWHSGSITDRINPLTLQPTCYLASRTVVTVKMASPYPHVIRPEGPLLEHLVDSDEPGEGFTRDGVPQSSVMVEDDELQALYRELVEIQAKILSRWTALFASNPPSNTMFRSQRDDDMDDEDRHDLDLQIRAPTVSDSSPKVETGIKKSAISGKPAHPQDESKRRASSRQVVKRIPYIGGSGEGLAKKNGGSSTRRKPVNERWSYDLVPALVVTTPSSEIEPPINRTLANGELGNGEEVIASQSRDEFTHVEDLV